MLLWLILLSLSLLASVLCYLTNPIVVLFADENGELPGVLSLWQTWDNSCNPSDIKHIAPSFLQFDWDAHYTETEGTTTELQAVNRTRWFTPCIDADFTAGERFKRYLCRVLWLTRNSAYGFGFWTFGLTAGPYYEYVINEPKRNFVRELCGGSVGGAWRYVDNRDIFKVGGYTLRWNVFLGWKLATEASVPTRCAIANRVAFKIVKEGG